MDNGHDSDCAVHRAPAYPAGKCNCQHGTVHDEPIVEFTIPGTFDVPSVTFGFNTVNRLPEKANPSAVVSYDGRLWIYSSKPRATGTISAIFLIFYGSFRFLVEFTREPDDYLGLLSMGLSMGQWLSLPMIVVGLIMLTICQKRNLR